MIEIDIEYLVEWTYRRQKADIIVKRGAGLHEIEAMVDGIAITKSARCGCAGVARGVEVGCRVDGVEMPNGTLHPDAEAVHGAVRDLAILSRTAADLVMQCGRYGGEPDWMPAARTRYAWVPNKKGGPTIEYDQHRHPFFSPVLLIDAPEIIAFRRSLYVAWRDGLVWLRHYLGRAGTLAEYAATGPKAAPTPWMSTAKRRA